MKAIAKHTLIMTNGKTLTTKDKEYEMNIDTDHPDFYYFVNDQNKNEYLMASMFRHFFSKVKEEADV